LIYSLSLLLGWTSCSIHLLDGLVGRSLLYNLLKQLLVVNCVRVLSVNLQFPDEFASGREWQSMDKLDPSSILS